MHLAFHGWASLGSHPDTANSFLLPRELAKIIPFEPHFSHRSSLLVLLPIQGAMPGIIGHFVGASFF
jgi:hypothetical protein